MVNPENMSWSEISELLIGKFVKISVTHSSDLIVTSYGTISYDDNGWRVAGDIGDYSFGVYFKPSKTRILEGVQELHLVYEI